MTILNSEGLAHEARSRRKDDTIRTQIRVSVHAIVSTSNERFYLAHRNARSPACVIYVPVLLCR